MTDVRISGVGMTKFGKFPDVRPRALAHEAARSAVADSGISANEVEVIFVANVFAGTMQGQESVKGQAWLDGTEFAGIPVFNIENACASGSSALSLARTMVSSGEVGTALVLGVEKLTHEDKGLALRAMEGAMDQEKLPELRQQLGMPESGGSPFMQVYADYAETYMLRSGATAEDFARVASKASENGSHNECAQFRKRLTVEEILAARPVAGPLTVPMCAPIGDGAAAAVVRSGSLAGSDARAMRLLASVVGAGVRGRDDQLVRLTAKRAYTAAGLGPEDIDVMEIHDAAAPAEMIVLEDLDFAPTGGAVALVRDQQTSIGGRIPVNPSGGLVSKGHPLGATGLAQIFELVEQLRGEAGDRQVENARVALAENAGGYLGPEAVAATISILARP